MGKGWERTMATLKAYARLGHKEIAQALKAFPDSIHTVEEVGTASNPTQLEVNQEKGNQAVYGDGMGANGGYQAMLASRAKQAEMKPAEQEWER
jgi:hypothetical protein